MKTQTKEKKGLVKDFDPVKMMRDIRDKLSLEIKDMTHEQEKAYLKKLLSKS